MTPPEITDSDGNAVGSKLGNLVQSEALELFCSPPQEFPSARIRWQLQDQWGPSSSAAAGTTVLVSATGSLLRIEALDRRHHGMKLRCTASRPVAGAASAAVTLDVFLAPVQALLVRRGPLVAGVTAELECVAWGSRPEPTLRWTLGGRPMASAFSHWDGRNVSTATVTLRPAPADHGRRLVCAATNPKTPAIPSVQDSRRLDVHCNDTRRIGGMASRILANGGGCSPDIALRFFNAVASARVLYAVPLVALRPAQWDALDTLHRGVVRRRLYGLPRSSPIGPTLAEAGETSLSLRVRGSALRHIHRMYLTSEGRRLAGRLLDRPHSRMGQRALERFRFTNSGSPSCAECPAEETTEHILLHCPGYTEQRRRLFDAYGRLGLPHVSLDHLRFPQAPRSSLMRAFEALLEFFGDAALIARL
ncbi:hypothetical protein MRX96_036032 [Rhipicephalus microplus]